eukprot:4695352-Karenia_brevis.AAC.1
MRLLVRMIKEDRACGVDAIDETRRRGLSLHVVSFSAAMFAWEKDEQLSMAACGANAFDEMLR